MQQPASSEPASVPQIQGYERVRWWNYSTDHLFCIRQPWPSAAVEFFSTASVLKFDSNNAGGVLQFQPRVGAQRQPWDRNIRYSLNPERVRQPPNPFRVGRDLKITSQGSRLRSNPGLKLANASGVFIQRAGTLPASFVLV